MMGGIHADAHGDARKAAFLAAFRLTGNVTASAEAAEVSRRTPYGWLNADPAFKADFEDAEQEAIDHLEKEARRRAEEGVVDYVVSQGKLVYIEDPDTGESRPLVKRVYSDTLMVLLLKAHRPEKYRERQSVEHSGPAGGPIQVDDARERLAGELDRLAERQRATQAGSDPQPG